MSWESTKAVIVFSRIIVHSLFEDYNYYKYKRNLYMNKLMNSGYI